MRIVIVEDEVRIREGLIHLFERIEGDHEIAGTAETGEEGLALIERGRPDLVVTDIKLPGMDGLRMLEALASRDIPFKAIILSAYSEFSYAQRAIKLGVSEYLVKPVSFTDFSRSINAVTAQLERERLAAQKNPRQLRTLENILYAMIQSGLKPDADLKEYLSSVFNLNSEGNFAAVEIYAGTEEGRTDLAAALDVLLQGTRFFSRRLSFPRPGETCLILYNLPDAAQAKNYFLQSMIPALRRSFGRQTVFAWKPFHRLEELEETVAFIRKNIDWSITMGAGKMLDFGLPPLREPHPYVYPLELETRAKAAACAGDTPALIDCLGRLFDSVSESAYPPDGVKDACTRFVLAVFNALRETGKLSRRGLDLKNVVDGITAAVTKEELVRAVSTLEEFPEAENPVLGTSLPVRRAEQLIRDFFCRDLTLHDLAAKLDLAPGYLGSLFHKETGLTFNNFLRDCRIRKAKELLVGTDQNLSSVASAVGFSDPKYFSRVFRESTGMLPADFRKLHR